MVLTTALRRAAKVNGGGIAIAADDGSITWRELRDRAARLAGALRAMGIAPGDRVAILSTNRSQALEAQYATLWAGALLVPLNFRFAPAELRHALQVSGTKLLWADSGFQKEVSDVKDAVDGLSVAWLDEGSSGEGALHSELLRADPIDDHGGTLSEAAGIFFTGGTTGPPKGVTLTHQNILVQVLEMRDALEMEATSVYAHIMPMFHLADFGVGHAVTLAAGTHCFLSKFSAQACAALVASRRITHLSLVPTMLSTLLDEVDAGHVSDEALQALAAVKVVGYGAAPISAALLERLSRRLPRARLRQFYGLTESCGACVTLAPEFHGPGPDAQLRMRSVGQPMASVDIRIVHEDGRECATSETGEILLRGPLVMSGYWGDASATARALRGGWLHTGDLGVMDEGGFLTLRDRSKDMIISGGENVFSIEVEDALASHDAVIACAVLGLPDEHWGERVHAVIVIAPDHHQADLADRLTSHCRARIAGYKIPRSWTFRRAPLPLSGVGKVQKHKLREEILRDVDGYR